MKLKHIHNGWVKDEVILLAIFWATVGLYLAFLFYLSLTIKSITGLAAVYFHCLNTDQEPETESRWSVSAAIIFLTLLPLIIFSVGMDLVCLWKVQKERALLKANKKDQFKLEEPQSNQSEGPEVIMNVNELGTEQGSASPPEGNGIEKALNIIGQMSLMVPEGQPDRNQVLPVERADSLISSMLSEPRQQIKDVLNEMPIRSTLLNTLFLVPYIIIMVALGQIGNEYSEHDKNKIMGLPYLILAMCRTWLVATCTFKVNDLNKQKDEVVERERKRQEEIKEAMEKRRLRQAQDPHNETEENHGQSVTRPTRPFTSLQMVEIDEALTKRINRNKAKATKVMMEEIHEIEGGPPGAAAIDI